MRSQADDTPSLDPEDWDRTRALGHRMLDDMFDFLRTVGDRPVWRSPGPAAHRAFERPLNESPGDLESIYRDFTEHILPFGIGNTHPRFWGWVNGTGTVSGMLADMLASGMNGHVAFGDHSAVYVEQQVLRWLVALLGLPPEANGVLVSSGSVATLTGLTVARDTMWPEVLTTGVRADTGRPTVYASDQVHNSVDKMIGVLGLGRDNLRRVTAAADFTCDVTAVAAAIERDVASGCRPLCIVGTAGTVNTGAVDDLTALADLAERTGLWFHVDAAFGAALALSPTHRHRLRGLERADSIAFDLHKWFYLPYDIGCAIIRRPGAQEHSFSPPAAYLESMPRGIAAKGYPFGQRGLDLSRGFRALKVWMCLQEHGTARYAEQIDRNVDQARGLANLIAANDDLELLAPVTTNVVCFRHRGQRRLADDDLDDLNRDIVMTLHERGIAAPSFTRIRGAFAIRVAITNHRSRWSDFAALVDAVLTIGSERQQDTVTR